MDIDLFLLNKLTQIKDANSGPNASGVMPAFVSNDDTVQPTATNKPIVNIWSTNCRSSSPTGTWSNTHPVSGESFYSYDQNVSDRWVKFWMPQSQMGQTQTNVVSMNTDEAGHDRTGGIQFAAGGTCGVTQFNPSQNMSTSYTPLMTRIMFLKNTTNSAINYTPYFWTSCTYNSGYDGASLTYYVPNAAKYGDVTGVSSSQGWSYQSNTWVTQTSGSAFSIPAKTTVAVVLHASQGYWTSTYSIYWCYQHNGFYNLQTMPAGIVCDLKASLAYVTQRDTDFLTPTTTKFTESDVVKFYNNIATTYGENE
jgi:hypothetical protein